MRIAPEHPNDIVKAAAKPLDTRRFSPMPPAALLIGASTGGPQALEQMLTTASSWLRLLPIAVVLHAPPGFIEVVAANIARASGMPTRIACHGDRFLPGTIYFAPGDKHLRVMRADRRVILMHSDGEPENFCKPAVDVLFSSAARAFGPEALGIVLTGMGRDGLIGARLLVEAGGAVVVQDEASSAVWGMPGSIARAGLASAILPLSGIASALDGLMVATQRRVMA